MNVLAKLLAETGANLIGARPEPGSGRQAENGAFRSLLERVGLSGSASPDGAPAAAVASAAEQDPNTSPEDTPPVAAGKRIAGFAVSLSRFDRDERNGEDASQANPNLTETVTLPAAVTTFELLSPVDGDTAQADSAEIGGLPLAQPKPRIAAARAHPSTPTASLDAKASIDVSSSHRWPPSVPRRSGPTEQVSRVSPTLGDMPAIATPKVHPVVVADVHEETHLPPAKALGLSREYELPRAERADRQPSRRDSRAVESATDRKAEARHGARGGDPDAAASSPARAPATQQHAVRTAPAAGAPAGTGGGLPAAALQTLASAIGDAAGPAPAKVVTPSTPSLELAKPGPVRDVALKLEIPDHGALSVRMSLNGRALTVRLNAERDETAHRLRHDRDALSHLLRQAGYDPNIVSIEGRRPAATLSQHTTPQSGSAPSGNQAGSDAASSGGQQTSYAFDQQPQHRSHFPPVRQDQTFHETNQLGDRNRRGLYV